MKKLVTAAQASGAHADIIALPKGYETEIGPAEFPFSGGLAQRICLARAIFLDPPMLIWDQPESHLDQDGIDMVSELILSAKATNRCVLVTSRTPSILSICDQVLVLDKGTQQYLGSPLENNHGPIAMPRKAL